MFCEVPILYDILIYVVQASDKEIFWLRRGTYWKYMFMFDFISIRMFYRYFKHLFDLP